MVETLLDQEIDTKFLVDKNLTMTPNGSLYTRKKQGFLPGLWRECIMIESNTRS